MRKKYQICAACNTRFQFGGLQTNSVLRCSRCWRKFYDLPAIGETPSHDTITDTTWESTITAKAKRRAAQQERNWYR